VAINQESERDLLSALTGNMPVTITINPALNNESSKVHSLTTEENPINLSMLESIFKPEVLERFKLSEFDLNKLTIQDLLTTLTSKELTEGWKEKGNEKLSIESTFSFKDYYLANSFVEAVGSQSRKANKPLLTVSLSKADQCYNVYLEVEPSKDSKGQYTEDLISLTEYAVYAYKTINSEDYYYKDANDNSLVKKEVEITDVIAFTEQEYSDSVVKEAVVKEAVVKEAVVKTERYTDYIDSSVSVEQSRPVYFLNDSLDTAEEEDLYLKVPAAVLGEWKHPVYKKVKFTEKDFEDIINNFNNKVLTYEPTLTLGHVVGDELVNSGGIGYTTIEGAPSEAFLTGFYVDNGVLYSTYKVVNKEVYKAVKEGRYRYSSGEFYRGYKDRETGADLGTVMFGMALTNRPFLRMPRVEALTDTTSDTSVAALDSTNGLVHSFLYLELDNNTETVSKQNIVNEKLTTEDIMQEPIQSVSNKETNHTNLSAEYESKIQALTTEIGSVKDAFQAQIQTLSAQNEQLTNELMEMRKREKQNILEADIAFVNSLCISDEIKNTYCTLLKEEKLGSSKTEVLSSLAATAQAFSEQVTKQYGTNTTTHALNDPQASGFADVDPYKHIVESNQEQLRLRAQRSQ
jgi:pterin-4a-carbinolamine dehydratase